MLVYQLTNARKALDDVSNYQGLEFAYAVFKNKQLIDNRLMDVEFIKNVTPQVVEYEKIRVTLCENFADKDPNGKPIIENDTYIISDKDSFKIKMDELLEKYKPFVDERMEQIELFNKKMNDIVDFQFIKIKKEQIPPQINTASELENISFMIE